MLQTHNKQNKSTMCGGGRRNGFSRGRRRAPCTDRMCVPREQTARGAILRGPESGGVGELPVWEGGGARRAAGRTAGREHGGQRGGRVCPVQCASMLVN